MIAESLTRYTGAEKFESFERINSIRETNGNFDSCSSCKRLVPSRLHELHESTFPFVSRIEFIRSKLSNFSAPVYGVFDFTCRIETDAAGVRDLDSQAWMKLWKYHWGCKLELVDIAHIQCNLMPARV